MSCTLSAGRVHSLGITEPFLVMGYGSKWVVTRVEAIELSNCQPCKDLILPVNNTFVFSCFEASDTVSNLHVVLDRFRGEVTNICKMKWK